jgi:hypothetical protein
LDAVGLFQHDIPTEFKDRELHFESAVAITPGNLTRRGLERFVMNFSKVVGDAGWMIRMEGQISLTIAEK